MLESNDLIIRESFFYSKRGDMAIGKYDKMVDYLRQGIFENYDWRTSLDELQQIMEV